MNRHEITDLELLWKIIGWQPKNKQELKDFKEGYVAVNLNIPNSWNKKQVSVLFGKEIMDNFLKAIQ